MRWQPLARVIVEGLVESGQLGDESYNLIRQNINAGNCIDAFRLTFKEMVAQNRSVGWNKVWQDGSLAGWYGPVTTIQTVRAATIELGSDETKCEAFRRWLNDQYHNDSGVDPESVDGFIIDYLNDFRLSCSLIKVDEATTRFLRRLNTDRRDQPIVERWHWSGSNGLAYLTNDARLQVTRETLWARAIETGLHLHDRLTGGVIRFLTGIDPDSLESPVPQNEVDEALIELLTKLDFYRFAHRLVDRVRFRINPGNFPSVALTLWSD